MSLGYLYIQMGDVENARKYFKMSVNSSKEYTRIDAYNNLYFLEKDIRSVRLMLNAAHNDLYSMLFSIDFKAPGKVLFLSLFLGVCGIDRFYIGDTLMGVFKLLTGGGFGIVLFIDWFTISKVIRERNYDKLLAYLY